MYSIKFPDMLSSAKTNLISDKDASLSNLKLLLKSKRGELFGDPYFGTVLHSAFFAQNGKVIADLVIDEIYACIETFMPQLKLSRKDISLKQTKRGIVAEIRCTNVIGYTSDIFELNLTSMEEDN